MRADFIRDKKWFFKRSNLCRLAGIEILIQMTKKMIKPTKS